MTLISTIIVMAVLAIIANAAFAAISGRYSDEEATERQLTPEEHLRRAYRSAYFTHASLADEARENEKGKSNDY